MTRSKRAETVKRPSKSGKSASDDSRSAAKNSHGWRETVESIAVAVILAFLFRGFVAEAFVIPTGSMAPTLQGRHVDVKCEKCGYRYRTGASSENADAAQWLLVEQTTCPICRFTMTLQRSEAAREFFNNRATGFRRRGLRNMIDALRKNNQDSFNGDRILVSKFAYQLAEPRRWDVIVFKYPGNAKQNYIKRLIGLPGEIIRIRHGDIFVLDQEERQKAESEQQFKMARKPPDKVKAMLQLVDDTDHIAEDLRKAGWPSRWQHSSESGSGRWTSTQDGGEFVIEASDRVSWLRYRHFVPWPGEWERYIDNGRLPPRMSGFRGELITDYYAYNDFDTYNGYPPLGGKSQGTCWVGDLAVECDVEVESDTGELLLELVEGGTHYECRFDLADGQATLSIGGGVFADEAGNRVEHPTAATPVRGKGTYHLRFANVDDQLLLWVNDRLVEFTGPTTYDSPEDVFPVTSEQDPGDLAPAGVGAHNASLRVKRLRMLRDVYYLAVAANFQNEYQIREWTDKIHEMSGDLDDQIHDVMSRPELWSTSDLFASRRSVMFELNEDQFFPLGDNSPQSKDARLWSRRATAKGYDDPPPYVKRELLVGKALLVYWPHAWRWPTPLLPNFGRMGLIR